MNAGIRTYLSEPTHQQWSYKKHRHCQTMEGPLYAGTYHLLCTPTWADTHLPPQWVPGMPNSLSVILLDTVDGARYVTTMPAFYEDSEAFLPPDWEGAKVRHLQCFMYADHFCACHRKAAAQEAGADTDDECEGERFLIERIEAPGLPGLILYSETIPLKELDDRLATAMSAGLAFRHV